MSFFSAPNSNRRIKRSGARRPSSLLEVTAAPDKEQRRQSWRRVFSAVKVVALVGALSAVALGGKTAVNRLIWQNPTYALDDIRVTTDGLLTRVQILELMEIQEGRNIFTVDLKKAKAALDVLPQVERVDIRRILPDRLDVRISERQPVAWVAPTADTVLGVDTRAFLVDTRGYVMRTRKVLPEHLALPVLIGVVMEDVAPGQKLPTAEAIAAVELIRLSSDDLRWQPRVVDVGKGYCLVVTDQKKAKITFGFDNLEGQLNRLRQVMDYVEPSQREFQSVNLMLERSVPIVFAPPPAPPVVVPEGKSVKGKPAPSKGGAGASVQVAPAAVVGAASGGTGAAQSTSRAAAGKPLLDASPISRTQAPPVEETQGRAETPARLSGKSLPAKSVPPAAPAPIKVAKIIPTERTAPMEKPKRRAPELEQESPPKVQKVERSVERTDVSVEKAKPVKEKRSEPSPRSEPASIPPSESLRKLFNPHG
jgi:cell division septal protein FtsQ